MASNPNYCDITPEIEALAAQSLQNSSIDPDDYVKYDVKRGLREMCIRDSRHTGHVEQDKHQEGVGGQGALEGGAQGGGDGGAAGGHGEAVELSLIHI